MSFQFFKHQQYLYGNISEKFYCIYCIAHNELQDIKNLSRSTGRINQCSGSIYRLVYGQYTPNNRVVRLNTIIYPGTCGLHVCCDEKRIVPVVSTTIDVSC